MPSNRRLRIVDFGLWVVAASATIIVASLAIGLAVGGDLITGKYILFVVGFLIFGVGSLLIQPSGPRKAGGSVWQSDSESSQSPRTGPNRGGQHEYDRSRDLVPDMATFRHQIAGNPTHEHRFEAKLQTIGPLADNPLPFNQRVGRGYKIFVTSLVVLAFSLGMELVGIHV